MLSMPVLQNVAAFDIYTRIPQDVPRKSVIDALYTPNTFVSFHFTAKRQRQESVFRLFSLFFCENTRNDLATQKREVGSNIRNSVNTAATAGWYILSFIIDDIKTIFNQT